MQAKITTTIGIALIIDTFIKVKHTHTHTKYNLIAFLCREVDVCEKSEEAHALYRV